MGNSRQIGVCLCNKDNATTIFIFTLFFHFLFIIPLIPFLFPIRNVQLLAFSVFYISGEVSLFINLSICLLYLMRGPVLSRYPLNLFINLRVGITTVPRFPCIFCPFTLLLSTFTSTRIRLFVPFCFHIPFFVVNLLIL